jgi:hypothetical protein
MSPEEWLRERGIEVKRGQVAAHGDIAGQFTGALPALETDAVPVDAIETQRIPAMPAGHGMPPTTPPLKLEPDIATLPTGALQGASAPSSLPPNIRVVRVDSLAPLDDGIDLWPTVALPVVKTVDERTDITQMPTRRLSS